MKTIWAAHKYEAAKSKYAPRVNELLSIEITSNYVFYFIGLRFKSKCLRKFPKHLYLSVIIKRSIIRGDVFERLLLTGCFTFFRMFVCLGLEDGLLASYSLDQSSKSIAVRATFVENFIK